MIGLNSVGITKVVELDASSLDEAFTTFADATCFVHRLCKILHHFFLRLQLADYLLKNNQPQMTTLDNHQGNAVLVPSLSSGVRSVDAEETHKHRTGSWALVGAWPSRARIFSASSENSLTTHADAVSPGGRGSAACDAGA